MYYSQHGEDVILDALFRDKERGFFVEVGCIDGRRFSNSLTFEDRGWRGICVEAHAGYIELLTKNRPNSIVCHCAAGEIDEETTFYANARGSLSTLDKSMEKRWKADYAEYFSGFEMQKVNKVRLSTLFDQLDAPDIDFLSLDIEGYELEALKGINFSKHRPAVLVVEVDAADHEVQIDAMLKAAGYAKSLRLGPNLFYFRDPEMVEIIAGKVLDAELCHTRHPLDEEPDKMVPAHIDLRLAALAVQRQPRRTTFREKLAGLLNRLRG
jgi:FkbM family methyltransferase